MFTHLFSMHACAGGYIYFYNAACVEIHVDIPVHLKSCRFDNFKLVEMSAHIASFQFAQRTASMMVKYQRLRPHYDGCEVQGRSQPHNPGWVKVQFS